jgi:hypothetical protein
MRLSYLTNNNKYVRLSSEEPQLAVLCMEYLSFDCFGLGLTEAEIRGRIVDACYVFQDYAAAHWLSHLEASVKLLKADDPSLANVIRAASTFLRLYWRGPSGDKRPPQALQKRFEALKSHHLRGDVDDNLYGQILHVACFISKATSPRTGEPLVAADPLRLNETIRRIRAVFEAYMQSLPPQPSTSHVATEATAAAGAAATSYAAATTAAELEAVRSAYGPEAAWFKCPRPTCVRFYDGFPTAALRDRHENDHARPYRCKVADCGTDVLGFRTKEALARHVAACHAEDDSCLFPAAKRVPIDPFAAARAGNVAALERMLADGVDLNLRDRRKRTLLHVAAMHSHTDIARMLIESRRVDINAADAFRNTPLWYAVETGATDIVDLLLSEESVQADCECEFATTPFWKAADKGHGDIVRILRQRPDVDETKVDLLGQTAISRAAAGGHEDVMRLLLDDLANDREAVVGQALT